MGFTKCCGDEPTGTFNEEFPFCPTCHDHAEFTNELEPVKGFRFRIDWSGIWGSVVVLAAFIGLMVLGVLVGR